MSQQHPDPDELAAIRAELEALGEDIDDDELEQEWTAAALANQSLDAVRLGVDAIEALPQPSASVANALSTPLAGMHRIRASRPDGGELTDERAAVLLGGVMETLDQAQRPAKTAKVIPFPARRWVQAAVAMAATFLVVAFVGLIISSTMTFDAEPPPHSAPAAAPQISKAEEPAAADQVEPFELNRAEERLAQVERSALKAVMGTGAASQTPGDHALRSLRKARYDAIRARQQARARRL